jgi:hypothetical protein
MELSFFEIGTLVRAALADAVARCCYCLRRSDQSMFDAFAHGPRHSLAACEMIACAAEEIFDSKYP